MVLRFIQTTAIVFFLPFFSCLSPTFASSYFDAVFSQYVEEFPSTLTERIQQGGEVLPEEFCIDPVYRNFKMQPLWVTENGPGKRAAMLLSRLREADLDGLEPANYTPDKLDALWASSNPYDLAKLDVMLTSRMLAYLGDVQEGRRAPRKVDPKLFANACDIDIDPVFAFSSMRESIDFTAFLDSYVPIHFQYIDLRQALVSYRSIAKIGGWPKIPVDGPMIRPGQSDNRIPTIRRRLAMTGDHHYDHDFRPQYTTLLEEAVRQFQHRHGLKIDGVIGPNTLAALNVPVEEKIRQILLNMERWRWKKQDLGRKYILVDIAGFQLQGIEDGRAVVEMPVIVGKSYQQTPVFSDRVRYVVFNPFWNIPRSIARKEMLPELIQDPGYLAKNKIRVFSSWQNDSVELDPYKVNWNELGNKITRFKLRQDSGPWNVLGKIKFVFPNHHNVYLHDTLAQELFKKHRRTFSHGCIRVAEPEQLAHFVLGGEKNGWTYERIEEMTDTGKRSIVPLPNPVNIHITYRTVWLDSKGVVHFRPDVYERDKKLIAALFEKGDEIVD